MIRTIWEQLPGRFSGIAVNTYMIMPNHFQGIIYSR